MPYKDSARQTEYQRVWMAERRAAWLHANGPCVRCGSEVDLEIDHRDSKKKVSHKIFSWSKKRRERELAKCQVLCRACHMKKSAENGDGKYKLTPEEVAEIRRLRKDTDLSLREIGEMFGVGKQHVHRIVREETRTIT